MQSFLPSHAERLIAAARLVLVASSLLAIWLDPHEPATYAGLTSRLLSGYFLYALVVAVLVWSLPSTPALLPSITHAFDLVSFSIFMYFTGPMSPFFVYLVFALLCATLRWQGRGTLWTAVAAVVVVTGIGLYTAVVLHDPEFELDSFIIRSVYLAVAATLLSYLGLYVQRRRSELTELAEWPHVVPQEELTLVRDTLGRAAEVLHAPRVLLAWEEAEEPGLQLASWDTGKVHWTRVPPDTFQPLVAEPLAETSFLGLQLRSAAPMVFRQSSSGVTRWRGVALHPELQASFAIDAALALPLRGETFHGHLFFLDKQGQGMDDLVLGELVAREVEGRIDLFYLLWRLKQAAATEERIRLACDLHDGLLQSLTGMALQLQTLQRLLHEDPLRAQERLRDIQTLVASEQRGLRLFVREMKSLSLIPPEPEGGLAARLEQLVQRIQREWGLRVELSMGEANVQLPGDLAQQIYLIVREALINAARHAQASAVDVTLNAENEHVCILVADNGRGFPFRGFYDHAKLTEMKLGPVALKGRIASLGGSLAIDSTDAGARLDIRLPLARPGVRHGH
jgi:signal transduction histidine kinase